MVFRKAWRRVTLLLMSKHILNWCDKVKTKLQRWTLTDGDYLQVWLGWCLMPQNLSQIGDLIFTFKKILSSSGLALDDSFTTNEYEWELKHFSLMSILLGSWVHCCTWKLKHKHSKRANSGRLICNFLSYTVAFDNLLGVAWLKEWWILFFLSNAINFCKTC